MRKPRILIVSYLFPPAGGIAVQRALSLARYLPDCGFDVHVLTASTASAPVRDPGLLKRVPASVRVHRAFSPEVPFRLRHSVWRWLSGRGSQRGAALPRGTASRNWKGWLRDAARSVLFPDPEVLWVPFAVRKARRVISEHKIDALLVTAPPFSAFLAGNALKREFPRLLYVADFRDEWLDYFLKDFDYHSGAHARRRAAAIERATVGAADLVVAVADRSLEAIRKRYLEEPEEKFARISNGYDPEAFRDFHPRPSPPGRMIVTHMGTVYRTATPRFYLDALDAMPQTIRDKVETRFIGRIADDERGVFERRGSDLRLLGFMPQQEALRWLEETDYLLLTMTNDISLPGKLYEYLASRKPILAISPPNGEVRPLLERTGAGACASPDDPEEIRRMLAGAWEAKRAGRQHGQPDEAQILGYARPRLAEAYGDLIKSSLRRDVPAPAGATA